MTDRKKILVICQYYNPEPFRITDICEELVKSGHEVHVVTGYPNYPEGILYEGYGKGKHIDETVNGVRIHRSFTIPRETGTLKRMLNYYSYAISSKRYVLSKNCKSNDESPFDVVFCYQLSPVMMAEAAIAYKNKHKIPCIMYCLDIWPESLIAGGISRTSPIYKFFHLVSKRIYRRMDKILISSRLFKNYLTSEFGIDESRIEYLPQYAESIFEDVEIKEETEIFNFTFAGNIGEIQSVDTIIEAARLLETEPVKFHIVGGGTDLDRIKKLSEGLNNVIFYGRRPVEEMPSFYKAADAMLITLKDDPVLSLTLPGKVQSYMAAGKPIIGAINGETKEVIEEAECGYCAKALDSYELATNIKKFIENKDRIKLGLNSRNYYEKNFKKNVFMSKIEKYF